MDRCCSMGGVGPVAAPGRGGERPSAVCDEVGAAPRETRPTGTAIPAYVATFFSVPSRTVPEAVLATRPPTKNDQSSRLAATDFTVVSSGFTGLSFGLGTGGSLAISPDYDPARPSPARRHEGPPSRTHGVARYTMGRVGWAGRVGRLVLEAPAVPPPPAASRSLPPVSQSRCSPAPCPYPAVPLSRCLDVGDGQQFVSLRRRAGLAFRRRCSRRCSVCRTVAE